LRWWRCSGGSAELIVGHEAGVLGRQEPEWHGIALSGVPCVPPVARRIADTAAYRQSRKDRKKVEVLFAHLKRILKLDRLRLRGRHGARDEFLLAATAQNLRRMAKRAMQMPVIEPISAT
jgi:hypothetical protein